MGISGSSGVSFTTFQLRGAAYDWWRTYELDSPDEAASLSWIQFSDMFLREFVPQSLRDAWRAEFEHFCQGAMTISEYTVHYTSLDRYAPALVSTVREKVRRFNEGLIPSIRSSMARELEMDISYQQVVNIARKDRGGMHATERGKAGSRERESRRDQGREFEETRRPRRPGRYTDPYFGGRVRHGRGFVGQRVQFAL
ncbi:uncharacterized protein [Nicotiana sylvestris]|uniref:uncharacterized protein n=1 Tax=Nicotiana sylvestris TaxID=4096 RepID=UPI00388C971D